MLKTRLITAIIGLPILLLVLAYASRMAIIPIFMIFVGIAVYEAASMLFPRLHDLMHVEQKIDSITPPRHPKRWPLICVGMALVIFWIAAVGSNDSSRAGMLIVGLLLLMLVAVFSTDEIEGAFGRLVGCLISVCYAGLPWLAIWDLYLMGDGSRYVLLLLAIVWAGDTGGYFGGRMWGKTKLAPTISPKKTWEGAISGFTLSIVAALIMNMVFLGDLAGWGTIAITGMAGGFFGQLGDLVESTIKRFSHVKDSGVIFPGHGGFLDRVDGLLFAAPAIWFILFFFGGKGT